MRNTQHPAVQAWNQLCSKHKEPKCIELFEKGSNSVYRLDGVGPSGTAVIAKRSRAGRALVEQIVYEEILPHLPVAALRFYGYVSEPGTEYGWLFLEDAGGEEFAYSLEEHRRLAARWLGQMNVSAACIPAVSRLPDRGPKHYLDHLHWAQELIQRNLGNPALIGQDSRVLEGILLQCHFLEARWNCIEELCHRFPLTLVHGDFMKDNVRVRSSTCGVSFVAFDWGMAGYGIPAIDIAETSGRGVIRARIETELIDYWSAVREWWSDLDLTAIKQLADLGAVFRLLAAISSERELLDIGGGRWPIKELYRYQVDLALALEHLGFSAIPICG